MHLPGLSVSGTPALGPLSACPPGLSFRGETWLPQKSHPLGLPAPVSPNTPATPPSHLRCTEQTPPWAQQRGWGTAGRQPSHQPGRATWRPASCCPWKQRRNQETRPAGPCRLPRPLPVRHAMSPSAGDASQCLQLMAHSDVGVLGVRRGHAWGPLAELPEQVAPKLGCWSLNKEPCCLSHRVQLACVCWRVSWSAWHGGTHGGTWTLSALENDKGHRLVSLAAT